MSWVRVRSAGDRSKIAPANRRLVTKIQTSTRTITRSPSDLSYTGKLGTYASPRAVSLAYRAILPEEMLNEAVIHGPPVALDPRARRPTLYTKTTDPRQGLGPGPDDRSAKRETRILVEQL